MDRADGVDVTLDDIASGRVVVDVVRDGVAAVAVLAGEIDAVTAPAAQGAVAALVTDGRAQLVVVDLSAVTFLSSRGLQLLVEVAELVRAHPVGFRVVTGVNRAVVRPLEITDLDTVLPLWRTRAEALAPTSADGSASGVRTPCRRRETRQDPGSAGAGLRNASLSWSWAAHQHRHSTLTRYSHSGDVQQRHRARERCPHAR